MSWRFTRSTVTEVRDYKRVIDGYQCSVIEVPEARIDTATEIFTRINVTGKPLSVFEIMVAKTFDYDKDFDLAEKTNQLIDELADHDYGTLPDIVFLQVAATIMTKECSKRDILQLDKETFIATWTEAEDAIRSAVDYLRSSLLVPVSQLLPYKALLIPIAYFFAKHPAPPSGVIQESAARLLLARLSLRSVFVWTRGETRPKTSVSSTRYLMTSSLYMTTLLDQPKSLCRLTVRSKRDAVLFKAVLCCLAGKKPKSFKNNSVVFIS